MRYNYLAYWNLVRSFPKLLTYMCCILLLDVVLTMLNVVSIAPFADLLLQKPRNEWLYMTVFFDSLFSRVGLEMTLGSAAAIVWVSFFGISMISILVVWGSLKIRFSVVEHLVNQSYQQFYSTSWEYFLSVSKGELTNMFINETNQVGTAFFLVGQLLANILRLIALIIVPILVAPKLVTYCLLGLGLLAFPFLMVSRFSYSLGQIAVNARNRYVSLIRESLEGAREVLVFSAGIQTIKQLMRGLDKYRSATIKSSLFSSSTASLYEPMGFLVIIAVVVLGGEKTPDLSILSVVLWGFMRAIPQIKGAILGFHKLANVLPSLELIRKQQALSSSWRRSDGGKVFSGFKEGIRVENVSYAYPDGHSAITDVSLFVPKGSISCLVGHSGSGKSTLIDCAVGLVKPSQGIVFYDDVAIFEFSQKSLWASVAIVSQKPTLFDLSIRDNLLWANPKATDDELWQVCEMTGVNKFIDKFKHKMNTVIGESGNRLSGGQIQRIAISRALIKHPHILILDEATNALDGINEEKLYNNIFEACPDMTVIIIAHNMVTASKADRIFVVQNGEVTACGSYAELMKNNAYFDQLVDLQRV